MSDTIKPIEKFEWIDKDSIRAEIKTDVPIIENGQVVGSRKNEFNKTATAEEFIAGKEQGEERIEKNTKELEELTSKLEAYSEIPDEDERLEQLKKDLLLLNNMDQKKKLVDKINEIKENIAIDKEMVERRNEFLKNRPQE